MMFSHLPFVWVLVWALFATIFYAVRYRNVKFMKNPWLLVGIFAFNFFLFAWGAILFVLTEFIQWEIRKKG